VKLLTDPYFRIGPLRTTCIVKAGDGSRPIREDNVHTRFDAAGAGGLDGELAARYEQVARTHESGACRRHWNSPRFRLDDVRLSRNAGEDLVLGLDFSPGDYFAFLAAQGIDCRKPAPPADPANDPADQPPLPAYSFGINVAAITGDGLMVFARRSNDVAVNAGRWSASANEGLSRPHDLRADGTVDLFGAARRALAEEMTVYDDDIAGLDMLSVVLDAPRRQWAVLFCARLRPTAERLRDRWSRGVQDLWEHSEFAFVPAEPKPVLGFLLTPNRRNLWAPCAPALFYHALVRTVAHRTGEAHPRAVVEAAAESATAAWTAAAVGGA
jgi:hypothetical protein